ncbi:FHA domain-containing protein [Paludisphaera rhizosphaerae]|uniref:FHA domain-containing protein n=1 Tax=Paludisphaera rhizosphaerae TaxID=2711216 RepID=UPI0013EB2BCC|nr:FHA domain-containing protein [Paludisphaera rhizosphaerae]
MKSFSDACRLVEPLQLVVEAAGEPDVGVRVLHQPFALIGRDPRADVPLEHRLVSRRHVYLQVVEGHAFWIDLESRLGTLGGGRPRKYGWLTRDETIRIGPYELRRTTRTRPAGWDERLPEAVPLVSRSYGAVPWPDVGLEFLNGPSRSALWPMNRVVSLVGSAAGCKFRLADPSVSLFHCSLVRSPTGLWVVDLLGGGVEVNNTAVRYAMLEDDDVLSIGRYRIRVRSRLALEGPRPEAGRDRGTSRSLSLLRTPPPNSTMIAAARIDDENDLVVRAQPIAVIPAEIQGAGMGESASVLVPLMNQFGIMQQQMLDQFQSAMGMLVDMFGSLQREQMDLIRQELDQLREVTREFQDLKAELASYTRERAAGTPSPSVGPAVSAEVPATPTTPPAASVAASVSAPVTPAETLKHEHRFINPAPEAVEPVASPTVASSEPAPPAPAAAEGIETPTRRATAGNADQKPGARPAGRPRPEKAPRPEGADADVMLWLNQRIATLQEERETRWRKILKLLPGSS